MSASWIPMLPDLTPEKLEELVGQHVAARPKAKLRLDDIYEIRATFERRKKLEQVKAMVIKEIDKCSDASMARRYGVNVSTIGKICRGSMFKDMAKALEEES